MGVPITTAESLPTKPERQALERDDNPSEHDTDDGDYILVPAGQNSVPTSYNGSLSTDKLCAAAGVTKEYLHIALNFIVIEGAKSVGKGVRFAKEKKLVEKVKDLKRQCPKLEDIKAAYQEGKKGKEETKEWDEEEVMGENDAVWVLSEDEKREADWVDVPAEGQDEVERV